MWKNAEEATVQTVREREKGSTVSLSLFLSRKNRRRRLYLMPSTHTWVHWKTTITRHKRHESKQWEGNTHTHWHTQACIQFLLLLLLHHHQVWRYISIDQLKSAKMSGKSYQLSKSNSKPENIRMGDSTHRSCILALCLFDEFTCKVFKNSYTKRSDAGTSVRYKCIYYLSVRAARLRLACCCCLPSSLSVCLCLAHFTRLPSYVSVSVAVPCN